MKKAEQLSPRLKAFYTLLLLTHPSDWCLIHNTMRSAVAEGEVSKAEEEQYRQMVDWLLNRRRKKANKNSRRFH